MAKKSLIYCLVISMLAVLPIRTAWSRPTTTAEIIPETLSALLCLQYVPVAGICFFLRCTPFGCKIKTSVKVRHYNPDVVVSSYAATGESTWLETRAYSAPFIAVEGSGDDTGGRVKNGQHVATTFREVDAIGNPALYLMSSMTSSGMLCPSVAKTYIPYFLSSLDGVNWRFPSLELFYPFTWTPGIREIGEKIPGTPIAMNTWGAVYPRSGFITQNEGPKSNAVAAQRVGDIITRELQPHIYNWLSDDCSTGKMQCWGPGDLIENDLTTGWWQPLAPYPLPMCEVFGKNDTLSLFSWADNRRDYSDDAAWNLWRPYSCCKKKGIFLFSIDWIK